jgi:hypothetical protein
VFRPCPTDRQLSSRTSRGWSTAGPSHSRPTEHLMVSFRFRSKADLARCPLASYQSRMTYSSHGDGGGTVSALPGVKTARLAPWYSYSEAPSRGSAYDSHHGAARIHSCTRRRSGSVAVRGAGAAGGAARPNRVPRPDVCLPTCQSHRGRAHLVGCTPSRALSLYRCLSAVKAR